MTPEDRVKIDELKESFREVKKEAQKKSDIAAKEWRIESIAKTEYLWEAHDATEEDYPQLREWVEKLFDGNYHRYFTAYALEGAGYGPMKDVYPSIKYQMETEYNIWNKQKQEEELKREKRLKNYEPIEFDWLHGGLGLIILMLLILLLGTTIL